MPLANTRRSDVCLANRICQSPQRERRLGGIDADRRDLVLMTSIGGIGANVRLRLANTRG